MSRPVRPWTSARPARSRSGARTGAKSPSGWSISAPCRPGSAGVPADGHHGQYSLHHHLGQQAVGDEVRVARQRHLLTVKSGPAAGVTDPLPGAVTHRGPATVLLTLRPTGLGDLGLKHLGHHRHLWRPRSSRTALTCGANDIESARLIWARRTPSIGEMYVRRPWDHHGDARINRAPSSDLRRGTAALVGTGLRSTRRR